ncbi:MAG: peroxiredoxin family protein [Candidatus Rokubacteria bacterium]|nr:peroxiredoxin family protein [Candidatus Rokubacteria bacterium]
MAGVEIGQRAPSFRLASGQGEEIGPEDYRGKRNLIVWFTKGMACPFCRTHMSQLARGYPKIKALGAEILQVTPTKPERARFYARNFSIPFPYLCDPDYRVHHAWGVDVRPHSLAWYAKAIYGASKIPKPPPAEIGDPRTNLGEMPTLLHDSDMGFFLLDRDAVVRYKLSGAYFGEQGVRQIPSTEEILRELERCANPSTDPKRST